MTDLPLPHALERSVVIRAQPTTVFRYFTDSGRFAAWWGAGSTIDPRPGGQVLIRYPNGVTVRGEVLEIVPTTRICFTYGYDANPLVPPGGSRVTITLHAHVEGTRLELRHEFSNPEARDQHRQGWGYQLAVFANVVSAEAHANAQELVDRFFAAWSERDADRRLEELEAVTTPGVVFRDSFGATASRAELSAHIAAAQQHLGGSRLERQGGIRQCQGTALADWTLRGADGSASGAGSNVFDLGPDGRITRIVGLWGGR